MKVKDIDVVCVETLEARLNGLDDPLARLALFVGTLLCRVAELRRHDPIVALAGYRATDHLFGASGMIDVGGIDEVDALVERFADDALGRRFVSLATEHHCSEAER